MIDGYRLMKYEDMVAKAAKECLRQGEIVTDIRAKVAKIVNDDQVLADEWNEYGDNVHDYLVGHFEFFFNFHDIRN